MYNITDRYYISGGSRKGNDRLYFLKPTLATSFQNHKC